MVCLLLQSRADLQVALPDVWQGPARQSVQSSAVTVQGRCRLGAGWVQGGCRMVQGAHGLEAASEAHAATWVKMLGGMER